MKQIRFVENVKALAKQRKEPICRVCKNVGYSVEGIYNWAKRGSLPRISVVCDFADYFGVSLDDIVYKDFSAEAK